MSIVALRKITLCGLLREKHELLDGLQDLGCLHLIPLSPPPAEVEKVARPHAERAHRALRFLTDVPRKRHQVLQDPGFDMHDLVDKALDLKRKLRDVHDRRDFLLERIAVVEPWGDLTFPPHDDLAEYRLWFYVLPLSELKALKGIGLPWQIVHEAHRVAYVIVIAQEEPPVDLLPVPRSHVGSLPLAALRARLEEIEVELDELTAQRQALTRFIYLASVKLAEAEDSASLAFAEQQTLDAEGVVAVQGWVPVARVKEVEAFAERLRLACIVEEPGGGDRPPTLLDQPDGMAAATDLAMFYQVPGYRSWDPAVVLFASFSAFFAMILADAGYGLVLLAGLLLAWTRLGRSHKARSYRLLGLSLSGCTLVYGALVGSYFGLPPLEGSWLARLNVLRLDDFDRMMEISIVIGALHIAFANAMGAFAERARPTALARLGWMAAVVGGLLLWLGEAGSLAEQGGIGLLTIGLAAVLFFTDDRRIDSWRAFGARLLAGIQGLASISGAFGDVLSYMRLFALGLASASLAMTFNDLAGQIHRALPGLGLLAAILIVAVGHALNIGISLMGGVVHGLRLNFIEFYKWGLPEEGTPFRVFARKVVER